VFEAIYGKEVEAMGEDILEVHLEGKSAQARTVEPPKSGGRKCLYFDEVICTYPSDRYFFCRGCPRALLSIARSAFEINGKYVNAVTGLAGLVIVIILQLPNITAFLDRLFPGIIP